MKIARSVRHRLLAAVLLGCGVGCVAVAQAAGIVISPVVLEIDSPRKAIAVSVTNSGDRPVTFQSETLIWRQIDGTDQYDATDELLVVPPIVEIPPKASQILRLMLRSQVPSPVERTYRLILEDITEALAPSGQASVSFKLSHSLPVMVAPSGRVLNAVRWKPCAPEVVAGPAEVCVRLLNAGNRRVKLETLTVAGDGWQQSLALGVGENVLAGAQREWRVPMPERQTGTLRGVRVRMAHGETLQAESGGF